MITSCRLGSGLDGGCTLRSARYFQQPSALPDALCSLACKTVWSVSREDQRIGWNDWQGTRVASVAPMAIVFAQPPRLTLIASTHKIASPARTFNRFIGFSQAFEKDIGGRLVD